MAHQKKETNSHPADLDLLERESIHYSEYLLIATMITCLFFTGYIFMLAIQEGHFFESFFKHNHRIKESFIHYGIPIFFGLIGWGVGAKIPKFHHSLKRVGQWGGFLAIFIAVIFFTKNFLPPSNYQLVLLLSGLGASSLLGLILWKTRKNTFAPYHVVKSRILHGRCPKCGYIKINDKCFCARCGYKVSKKCNCGGLLLNSERFCPDCGVRHSKASLLKK